MKIAVSAEGNNFDSMMDLRFGRAPFFIIIDQDTGSNDSVKNEAAFASGGAGIATAQMVVDKGVKTVITGNVGPNAMKVLKAGDVTIYQGRHVPVQENIDYFEKGLLTKIESTVPAHFGMGGQGQR